MTIDNNTNEKVCKRFFKTLFPKDSEIPDIDENVDKEDKKSIKKLHRAMKELEK